MQFINTLRERIILTPGYYEIMKGFLMYHTYNSYHNYDTRRCFDVNLTSFERYGRQMDVETTLCAYWEV